MKRPDRSRLGQILIEKRLISQDQLDAAIRAQAASGRRLGEILADMRLITRAQVRGAVRRQRSLRLAAALAGALLGPLHTCAAVAAPAAAAVSPRVPGMRALSDAELGDVAAQGRNDDALRDQMRQAELRLAALAGQGAGAGLQAALRRLPAHERVRVLGELEKVVDPPASALTADTTMSDVVYDTGNSQATMNKDGSVTLRLPSTIGEIRFENIRVGTRPGPTFGSVEIHDIDLRGTTITVKPLGR